MAKPVANWEKIKREYVFSPKESRPSLQELAQKYNIQLRTIRGYAQRHNWASEAKQFDESVEKERQKNAIRNRSSDFEKIDNQVLSLTESLLGEVKELLAEKNQNNKQLKPYEINYLSQCLKTLHSLSIEVYGEMPHALETLMKEGILDKDRAEQIIMILERGEAQARDQVKAVIGGQAPD